MRFGLREHNVPGLDLFFLALSVRVRELDLASHHLICHIVRVRVSRDLLPGFDVYFQHANQIVFEHELVRIRGYLYRVLSQPALHAQNVKQGRGHDR